MEVCITEFSKSKNRLCVQKRFYIIMQVPIRLPARKPAEKHQQELMLVS